MSRRLGRLLVLALGCGGPACADDARPSFDCRRAGAADEKAICSDARLAQMDVLVAKAFGAVKRDEDVLKNVATSLKDRRDCGANRLCILDNQALELQRLADAGGAPPALPSWLATYRLALVEQGVAPIVPGLPLQPGSCTHDRIATIAARFSEKLTPEGGGTVVGFADGLRQVSYAYESDVAKSAVGDPVLVCLVSIPRNCPKGDDRGRFYSATNLRTRGTWIMPDAQHICGGA